MSDTQQQTSPDPSAAANDRAFLPESYRADPAFQDFKDVAGLAASYKATKSLVGADKNHVLRIPLDEAAPEWGEVWGKLGRPADAKGYELKGASPEDQAVWDAVAPELHGLNLTKTQAAGVQALAVKLAAQEAEKFATNPAAAVEAFLPRVAGALLSDQFKAESDQALKQAFGNAYDERMHQAQVAVKAIDERLGGELIPFLVKNGLGNYPVLVRAFAEVGMGSDFKEPANNQGGGGAPRGGVLTPSEANAELAAMTADREFGKRLDAGDAEAKARYKRAIDGLGPTTV